MGPRVTEKLASVFGVHCAWDPYDDGMTTPLLLRVLPPAREWESPFATVPGFNESWWITRWHEAGGPDADAVTLSVNGNEVARALMLHDAPEAEYVGLKRLRIPVELARIEVAEHRRGQDLGRRAVEAIAEHYRGHDMWVHGDALGFYKSTGWTRYERVDGDATLMPFFVLRA